MARERAGDVERGARRAEVVRQFEFLELDGDHRLRNRPGSAEGAARLQAAGQVVDVVLELRHLERPRELVGRCTEAAARRGAARAEARLGIGLHHAPADDARAAARFEGLVEEGAVGERPLQLDTRRLHHFAFRNDRAADGAFRVVAKSRRIEASQREVGAKRRRVGETHRSRAGHFAARGRGAQRVDLDRVSAPRRLRAEAHAFLREGAANALHVARQGDLERARELRFAQRRAQCPQVEAARLEAALEVCAVIAAASFQHAAADEQNAQVLERGRLQIVAGDASFDARDRQLPMVERTRRAVREHESPPQAAVVTARLHREGERRVRQLLAETRQIDRRDFRHERHEVLGAEGREDGARVRGDVCLAQRELQLEALERAAHR